MHHRDKPGLNMSQERNQNLKKSEVASSKRTSMLFCDVMQRWLVDPYRRFGTNYWLHLQFKKSVFWECLTLERGADRLSRNVGNYQLMLRDIPEEGKILFTPPRKSEIKHNGNFGNARFVTAAVT